MMQDATIVTGVDASSISLPKAVQSAFHMFVSAQWRRLIGLQWSSDQMHVTDLVLELIQICSYVVDHTGLMTKRS